MERRPFAWTAEERTGYERDGYVIRRNVFTRAELDEMAAHSEALVADLVRDRKSRRFKAGDYVFDPDFLKGVYIKWEGDTDEVHGIEPFAHLSKPLKTWGMDPRLVDPMRDLLNTSDPELFTEKLNLKRPRVGGPNPLHQDYPYWVESAEVAAEVATTIIYLDDSSRENGCTWVVPGSHTQGKWKTRTDGDEFKANEVDPAAYPDVQPIPVEVEAGATVSFGAFLVHQSTPNTSSTNRRALLYSYQPAGRKKMIEELRAFAAQMEKARAEKRALAGG